MYILREIVASPWFYWPFGILAVVTLVRALGEGASPGEALVQALVSAFFLAFIISGLHRLYRRSRR